MGLLLSYRNLCQLPTNFEKYGGVWTFLGTKILGFAPKRALFGSWNSDVK
jgi:hypothetical protein